MPLVPLDRADPVPLWVQLEAELRRRIDAGEFSDGRFPTDLELTEGYEVSRHTVREAIRHLNKTGILKRERGRGTVINRSEFEAELVCGELAAQLQPQRAAEIGTADGLGGPTRGRDIRIGHFYVRSGSSNPCEQGGDPIQGKDVQVDGDFVTGTRSPQRVAGRRDFGRVLGSSRLGRCACDNLRVRIGDRQSLGDGVRRVGINHRAVVATPTTSASHGGHRQHADPKISTQ